MSKSIGVITTSRADFSIYLPLLKKLRDDNEVDLKIFALGMHCSETFGATVSLIREQGFEPLCAADTLTYGDTPVGISKSTGETTKEMAQLLENDPVDLIVCLGDRFEMFGAVSAIIPFCTPIAHLYGGEVTAGAIDEKYRHALTKLSDLHLTSCDENSKRVIQMGADPKNVINVGSLGVENMNTQELISKADIFEKYQVDLDTPTVMITYQPVTTKADESEKLITEFLAALDKIEEQCVLTLGNADTNHSLFYNRITEFTSKDPNKYKVFSNLGPVGYPSFLKHIQYMLGNSSSGIIEAASFDIPVVNIGIRQEGRAQSENIINCENSRDAILAAVSKAKELKGQSFTNIYERENSSELIVSALKNFQEKPDYTFHTFGDHL